MCSRCVFAGVSPSFPFRSRFLVLKNTAARCQRKLLWDGLAVVMFDLSTTLTLQYRNVLNGFRCLFSGRFTKSQNKSYKIGSSIK